MTTKAKAGDGSKKHNSSNDAYAQTEKKYFSQKMYKNNNEQLRITKKMIPLQSEKRSLFSWVSVLLIMVGYKTDLKQ